MNLEKIPTYKLVDELAKREGVREIVADPYSEYLIEVEGEKIYSLGPARILEVID